MSNGVSIDTKEMGSIKHHVSLHITHSPVWHIESFPQHFQCLHKLFLFQIKRITKNNKRINKTKNTERKL